MIAEKRKTQRMPLNMEAVCSAGGRLFKAFVIDISVGGVKFESQTALAAGQYVSLTLEWERPLKLGGEIRWVRREDLHYLYGLEFSGLDTEQEAGLREITQDLFWKNFGG